MTVLGILVAVAAVVGCVQPAAAHTGFERSNPADGSVVEGEVTDITLVFTGPAEPTAAGFEILGPDGTLITPDDVSSVDGETWSLGFDPPLPSGRIGVRWTVVAPDAHPISGAFSFTVEYRDPPPTSVAGPGGSSMGGAGSSDATSPLEPDSVAVEGPSDDPRPAARGSGETDARS